MPARDITRVLFSLTVLVIASWWVPPPAHALPEIALQWTATDNCPDRAEIERRLVAQLGRALRDVDTTMHAEATVLHTDTGYALSLQTMLLDSRGTRSFRAPTCSEVADAAVLVLALSLDEAEAEREDTRKLADTPSPPPREPALAAAPKRARSHASLRASALLESGAMPQIGLGAEASIALNIDRSRLELAGLWIAPQFSARAPEGGRVEVGLWAARASYCHHFLGQRNRLGGCLGLEAGQMTAQGHELVEVAQRRALWSAALVALRLSSQLHQRIGLVLEPGLAVLLTRRRFVSTGPQAEHIATLHTPKATSKRVTFGIELFF